MRVFVPGLIIAIVAWSPAMAQVATSKPAPQPPSTSKLPLRDEESQTSYVVGLNIGARLRNDEVPIVLDAMIDGVRDGLANAKPRLTDDEMRTLLTQLQARFQERATDRLAHLAQTNKDQGAAFLKANAAKPGVTVLPSGLQYMLVEKGSGPKPALADQVVCNYRGTLVDGTEFDSSYHNGGPVTFEVGAVIKGWTQALQLMPAGSKWRLYVPSELGYGDKGKGAIGPNAVLIFDVELLSIAPKA